jgi:hypothetical protein
MRFVAPVLLLLSTTSVDATNTANTVASIERSGTVENNNNNNKNVQQQQGDDDGQGNKLRTLLKKLSSSIGMVGGVVQEEGVHEEAEGATIESSPRSLRGMATSSRMTTTTPGGQQHRRSLQAPSDALSCPSPGFTAALKTHQAGGTVTLASVGTMGRL